MSRGRALPFAVAVAFVLVLLAAGCASSKPAGASRLAGGPAGQTASSAPGGVTPVEGGSKVVISKKPQKYGVYIYRDGRFIPLSTAQVNYSGVWFGISLTSKKLAACYVSEDDVKDAPTLQEGDLLCIHYKNVGKLSWYLYPLTPFAACEFPGGNEAEMWRRPGGLYLGFVAIGPPKPLKDLFGQNYDDGYRFEQQRVKPEDIVYQEPSIIFARVRPVSGLPVDRYLVTAKAVSFGEAKDYQELVAQIPDEGAAMSMAAARVGDNFEGRRDAIRRFNEETAVRYILVQKEFVLKKNKIVDTGIMVNEENFIRFVSDGDFGLVLAPGEWDEQNGWLPDDQPFGKDGEEVPFHKGILSHPVHYRHFALRYERTTLGTQVRLQGLSDGTRVTVIYCPLYSYEESYQAHVKHGYDLHNQGRFAEAAAEYEAALKILPDYPYALNNLAWLHATATDPAWLDPKKALDLARRAAAFKPVKPYIMDTLSLAYYLNGDLEKALDLEEAAATAASEPEGYSESYNDRLKKYKEVRDHLTLARTAEDSGQYAAALKEFAAALALMPQCVTALDGTAWILATSTDPAVRDPARALSYAEKAHALIPDRAHVCDTLAEVYFANGRRDKALEMAKKAWYLEPGSDYYRGRVEKFSKK